MMNAFRGRLVQQSGVSAVEFALVLPILVVLLIGTFSAGLALHRQLSLDHSAREGARFGATLEVESPGGQDEWEDHLEEVIARTKEAAAGELEADVAGSYICVAFVDENNDGVVREQNTGNQPPGVPASSDWCFTDDRSEDRIQVLVARETDFDVVFWRTDFQLTATALARYER